MVSGCQMVTCRSAASVLELPAEIWRLWMCEVKRILWGAGRATVTGTVGPGTGVPTPAAGKGDKTSRDVDAFWFEAVRDAS